jgi:hypothetical protein
MRGVVQAFPSRKLSTLKVNISIHLSLFPRLSHESLRLTYFIPGWLAILFLLGITLAVKFSDIKGYGRKTGDMKLGALCSLTPRDSHTPDVVRSRIKP